MKKTKITKTVVSVIIILALAIFIVNINKLIPLRAVKEQSTPKLSGEEQDKSGTQAITDSGNCFGNYGLTSDTVIFHHADWCSYCNRMKPIVEELENEGYKFHWSETSNNIGVDVVQSCFEDVIQGGVPQFICAGTKEFKMGAIPKSDLKDFADNCI
jgi:thiol-disulfide isomerase/thioredoxin